MIISKTFCDICHKECDKERFGDIVGRALRMNQQAEVKQMSYEGQMCEDHFIKVADFIDTLKNAQHIDTSEISDQSDKERANTST